MNHKPEHHAIVIGASIGGLLAAQVLLEHFERVTIVERDRLPTTPQPRMGVHRSTSALPGWYISLSRPKHLQARG